MDKLTEILEAHRSLYSGDECSCGIESYYVDWWDFNAHLAEMLKPLLAEVWDEGFTNAEEQADGFAGVSGCPKENPYKTKETN